MHRRWWPIAALVLLCAVEGCDDGEPEPIHDGGPDAHATDAHATEDAATHDVGVEPDDGGPDGASTDAGPGDAAHEESDGGHEGDANVGLPDGGEDPCANRSDGALIHFEICDDGLTLWITDDDFIDDAIDMAGQGQVRVPVFEELVAGSDCDPQWSWHVNPARVEFVIAAIEVCDGCPWFVEEELDYWLETVEAYCPWIAEVAWVDDRR